MDLAIPPTSCCTLSSELRRDVQGRLAQIAEFNSRMITARSDEGDRDDIRYVAHDR